MTKKEMNVHFASIGGIARAKKLTPERRSEIARKASMKAKENRLNRMKEQSAQTSQT